MVRFVDFLADFAVHEEGKQDLGKQETNLVRDKCKK